MPGTDRVQVVKRESAALGGNAADDVPFDAPLSPQQDALESAGIYLQDVSNRDQNVYVDRSGTDLRLRDQNVTTPITLSQLRGQTVFAELSADTSVTSTTFVDVITANVTTLAGTKLIVNSTFALSNSGANVGHHFRIVVDGTAKRGAGVRYVNTPAVTGAIALVVTGLAAGAHTVKLQARVDSGTLRIRPVTAPDDEHACMPDACGRSPPRRVVPEPGCGLVLLRDGLLSRLVHPHRS